MEQSSLLHSRHPANPSTQQPCTPYTHSLHPQHQIMTYDREKSKQNVACCTRSVASNVKIFEYSVSSSWSVVAVEATSEEELVSLVT